LRDRVGEYFIGVVGRENVLTTPESLHPYLIDERQLFHGRARAVVFPGNVEQVSRVMNYCYDHGIPMVPQGGNTGYCGGATADESGHAVVLGFAKSIASVAR
jgi:FAD/FMN-containing dehydrogenase